MSRNAETVLDWADGTYRFRLGIEQLAELQEKTSAGPWYVQWALGIAVPSLAVGAAPPRDLEVSFVTDTIRLGLIGGGMEAVAAMKKVEAYAGPGQLTESISTAYAVIGVALQGAPEDEPAKKPGAGRKTATRSRAGKSGSRTSTASARPSG